MGRKSSNPNVESSSASTSDVLASDVVLLRGQSPGMPAPVHVPATFVAEPFTITQAAARGIDRKVLRGRRFRRLFRGVYIAGDVELTLRVMLRAAMLVLPKDVLVSHVSAARLWGFDVRGRDELEFSTNTAAVTSLPGVRLHRRQGRLTDCAVDELPLTGPDRTFVDCGTRLGLIELVQLAEHLLHTRATTMETLRCYCHDRHLDGVQRARRALRFVMEGAESPMETLVRLMLVFARLPCPAPNRWITDASGRPVARVDLLYERYKVVVEYDGWHHERDSRQRQRDRERRETLEGLGYRLIVVTNADLRTPQSVPWRVYEAIRDRGYRGPRPTTSEVWRRWFAKI